MTNNRNYPYNPYAQNLGDPQCRHNICFSGGSKGADQLFGELADAEGHSVFHWSFQNHHSCGRESQTQVLPAVKLLEADLHLNVANEYLDPNFPTRSEYVNNLLRRNYYQIHVSERIYASCAFDDDMKPLGGTAWAIIMGINQNINEVWVFDHTRDQWYSFERKYYQTNQRQADEWWPIKLDSIPPPHGLYAGIGSSELPENGRRAIRKLYEAR